MVFIRSVFHLPIDGIRVSNALTVVRSKYYVCGLVIDAVNHINDENNALENMSKYICMEEKYDRDILQFFFKLFHFHMLN